MRWIGAVLIVSGCNVPQPFGADGGPEPDAATIADAACPAPSLIYINRLGGTYVGSEVDDSRMNESSIVDQAVTVLPATYDDAQWAVLMDCVASKFAPFHVLVTDVDPETAPHLEMVVTDRAQVLGMDPQVGAVISFTCDENENVIGFVFSEVWPDEIDGCIALASEAGHAIGLVHVFEATGDLMSYLPPDPAAATFVDAAFSCGDYSGLGCVCTGEPTQNSYQQLLAHYGPRCGP